MRGFRASAGLSSSARRAGELSSTSFLMYIRAACLLALFSFWLCPGSMASADITTPASDDAAALEWIPQEKGTLATESTQGIKVPHSVVRRAGFIITEDDSVGSVLDTLDKKSLIGEGNWIYIDIGSENSIQPGDKFTVFSKDRMIRHTTEKSPVYKNGEWDILPGPSRVVGRHHDNLLGQKGKLVGYLAQTLAIIEVTEVSPDKSKATVRESYHPLKKGDLITPYQETADLLLPRKNLAVKEIDASILASASDQELIGVSNVVYIDKGSVDNVEIGDWFEVYYVPREKHDAWYKVLPENSPTWIPKKIREYLSPSYEEMIPEVLGNMQVIGITEHTATLLMTKSVGHLMEPVGMMVRYKR